MTFENEYARYDDLVDRDIDASTLRMSVAEAVSKAEALLAAMGIEYMDACRVSLTSRLGNNEAESALADNRKHQAYAVTFSRTIAGIRSAFDDSYCNNEYNKPYYAERIRVHINDQGFAGFYWYGHTALLDTMTENVPLFPLDAVIARAAAHLEQSASEIFSLPFESGIEKIEYSVGQIKMGYAKTADPRVRGGFLLIPVWDFYGERRITYNADFIAKQNTELGLNNPCLQTRSFEIEPLITLSAVDGTVLDRAKGY